MLNRYLEQSSATPEVREAVHEFLRSGRPQECLDFDPYSPPVKVERTLTMLFKRYPELPIQSIRIRGSSGCEFYRGELVLEAGGEQRQVRFHWDCKWKAVQEGWTDYFGFPDQMRAAREFGYDCFRIWDEVTA